MLWLDSGNLATNKYIQQKESREGMRTLKYIGPLSYLSSSFAGTYTIRADGKKRNPRSISVGNGHTLTL
jgi:hypothetical protein